MSDRAADDERLPSLAPSAPADEAERDARIALGVRALREGHGANCSSVGSVVDTLFATAVLGGAIFAAVVAALGREKVRVVGPASTGAAADAPRPPGEGEREPPEAPRS